MCLFDPESGSFTPLNVFDQRKQSSFLMAASAVIDSANNKYLLNVEFASDGMFTRVVDIDKASATFGTIVANYTVSSLQPSNYHVLSA